MDNVIIMSDRLIFMITISYVNFFILKNKNCYNCLSIINLLKTKVLLITENLNFKGNFTQGISVNMKYCNTNKSQQYWKYLHNNL